MPEWWEQSSGASHCTGGKDFPPSWAKSTGRRVPFFPLSAAVSSKGSTERAFQTLWERTKSKLVSSSLSHGVSEHKLGQDIWQGKKLTFDFKIQKRCPLGASTWERQTSSVRVLVWMLCQGLSHLLPNVFVQRRSSLGPEGADSKFAAIAAYANGRIHLGAELF